MTATQTGKDRLYNWAIWAKHGEATIILKQFYPRRAAVCGQHVAVMGEVWDEDVPYRVDEQDAQAVNAFLNTVSRRELGAVKTLFEVGHTRIEGVPRNVIETWVDQVARRLQESRT